MKLRTRLFAVAALLALLGVPGLSCFVPQQLLGADEKECCRQMGSQCGSKDMSSPQSCCKSPSQQGSQPYIGGSGEHLQVAPVGSCNGIFARRANPDSSRCRLGFDDCAVPFPAFKSVRNELRPKTLILSLRLSAGAYVCPASTNFMTEDSDGRYSLSRAEGCRAQEFAVHCIWAYRGACRWCFTEPICRAPKNSTSKDNLLRLAVRWTTKLAFPRRWPC